MRCPIFIAIFLSLAAIALGSGRSAAAQDRYSERSAEGGGNAAETAPAGDNRELFSGFESLEARPLGSAGQGRDAQGQGGSPVQAQPYQQPMQQPPETYTPATAAPETAPAAPPVSIANTGVTPASTSYAERMIKAMLTPQPGSQLTGSATGLAEIVRTAGSRSEQTRRVNAYWDLCSAVADYYLSLHEQAELERLASRSPELTAPLRDAIAKLKTRRDTALAAAQATQLRLASLMGRGEGGTLVLPGDMPLCAAYHTRFRQNFPDGGPQEAERLHELLPMRHAELLDAATAVKLSEDWFDEIIRKAGDARAAEGVVRALELLALNRRAFVQIARDYNRRITRYTELARPGELRTERLVAMLIKTPGAVANRDSQDAAPPSGRRSDNGPPSTFLEGQQPADALAPRLDEDVLPVSGTEDQQRLRLEKVPPGKSSVLRRRQSG